MFSADKVALVTGGSRGIGRGIVRELAKLRWSVVINYRADAQSALEARRDAESLGAPKALVLQANVSARADGVKLVDDTLSALGRLDLLVNNAGIAPAARVDLLDTTPESWDEVMSTNLRGPFFLTQYAASRMLESVARGIVCQPQIVFISSISSVTASTSRGEYCVSKAGLSMVAQLFAARLGGAGILVHEVRPGLIATDMTAGVAEQYDRRIAEGLVPAGRWGTPQDVGRAVAAIASGSLSYSTGNVVYVDGGMNLRRL
jgi:NAD(P)-dependent dehydrogenase (short-subunit alcohol dehydrogenase family)